MGILPSAGRIEIEVNGMLTTIAVVLIVLAFRTCDIEHHGGLIHVLLVIAVIMFLLRVING